jgi:hypothetical protein
VPDHGYTPTDKATATAALEDLAATLTALPNPIDCALADITPRDISALLTRVPLERRKRALRPLGLQIAPRTVSQTLCRDVHQRLHRVHLHDAQHAVMALTRPAIVAEFAAAVAATEGDEYPDPLLSWSATVLRLALWSGVVASASDARLLLWAGTHEWWLPDGLSGEHGDAVLAAAQAVVDATPDFTFRDRDHGSAGSDHAELDHYDEESAMIDAASMPNATGSDPTLTDTNAQDAMPAGNKANTPEQTLALIRDERAALDTEHAAAASSTAAAAAAVDDGERVDDSDLQAIAAYCARIDRLTDILAMVGATSEPRIPALDAALHAIEQEALHTRTLTRLDVLRHLATPDAAESIRAQATSVAKLVDDVAQPDGQSGTTFEALCALVDLLDVVGSAGMAQADPQQLLELQTRATTGLPPSLASVPLAVITGQLRPMAATRELAESDTTERPITVGAWADATLSPPELAEQSAEHAAIPKSTATTTETPLTPSQSHRGKTDLPTQVQPTTALRSGPTQPDVDAVVAELIVERRFGLAAAIADAAGWTPTRARVFRVAALADAARGETGPCAARLRTELSALDPEQVADEVATLLVAVPALIRTALLTGEPTAGALLTAVAPRAEHNLGVIAEQVGRRALQGVLVGNPLRSVLADVTELETRRRGASSAAADRLRPRTLRFKRATDIAHRWLGPQGLLGSLLTAAADDTRAQIASVTTEVLRLSAHGEISKEIDRLDMYKGRSGKRIEGAGRQDLVTLATDAIAIVSAWLESVAAIDSSGAANKTWSIAELTEMRASVHSHSEVALAALTGQASRATPLARATARAARDTLKITFALLDGTETLTPGEPSADLALTAELLKIVGATVGPTTGLVAAPHGTALPALLTAAATSWPDAFEAQVAAEQYPAAAYLLQLEDDGFLTGDRPGSDAGQRLRAREHRSRTELAAIREQQLTELRRARLNDEVSEDQDAELTGLLDAADPRRRDLAVVRAELTRAADLLPRYREEAGRRLHERLDALVTGSRIPVDEQHIRRLIDDGRLSTAEELIYFCEIGEPVPEQARRLDLGRFFPAVPDALPEGLTAGIVEAVRVGGVAAGCAALDYSGLSAEARGVVASALDTWRLAGSTPPEERSRLNENTMLKPALRLTGFEFTASKAHPLNLPKGRERRFAELTEVSWNGRPMVPQFGSNLRHRLRVLLCWGQPAEDLLMSWVDQDTSGEAVLVAYFGTMSAKARRRMALHAARTAAPVAVLDDAALAYLAAHGRRQLDTTMSVLLPFSAVQPYARHKRSLVAPEMFYGRDAESRSVLTPEGTQVIFGGRGLGKSALMRAAKAVFELEPGRVAIHIELTTVDIGPGRQSADAVWDVLLRELEAAGVIATAKAGSRSKTSHEVVRAGVLDWLGQDTRRRLLILLDESDGFFESDAPRFLETNRLKDLGQASGVEGRAKVVFAGLHSVQRFAKMSNNTFKHLAQRPTVIGPLGPQFAYNLIAQPCETLGFTFEDPDLVNRILGYCSYQPFLLQMFGHRLVEHMHRKRLSGVGDAQPPFAIAQADIEAVEADQELKGDITSTFRDTLNLDPRYNVIANVLAHHAHEHGMDFRLSDVELRDECLAYWPTGFSRLDVEGFRAYLHEMVGLGVLARNQDGHGWHLRSQNVLRMMGSPDDVLAELVHAGSEAVPSEFIALSTRRLLPDGRTHAPLTARQVDDLLGDHVNQVRIVLGSAATGVPDVAPTLRAVCADLGERYQLLDTRLRRQFEEALVDGRPGQRRVVLSDLDAVEAKDEACAQALALALRDRPARAGVTRSVVIVAGTGQLGFWQSALADGDQAGLGVVTLRRHDRRSLRVWTMDTGRFSTEERQARLLEVTGGWPLLVERAAALAAERDSEDAALAEIARELDTPDGAAEFLDTVGLTADERLAASYDGVTQFIDSPGASWSDLVDAIGLSGCHPDPVTAAAALDALGVFDVDESGGYALEPLVVRCWPYRRLSIAVQD